VAVDFPPSPVLGETYSSGGKSWTYDGSKWLITATPFTPTLTDVATHDILRYDGDNNVWVNTNSPSFTGTVSAIGSGKFTGVGAISIVTSSTRPSSPTPGQVIYETDTTQFFGWNGSTWAPIGGASGGGVTASDTAPESPAEGDAWFDTTSGLLLIYYDGYWIEPSPGGIVGPTGPQGDPGIVVSETAPQDTTVLWADTSLAGIGHAGSHAAGGTDPVTLSMGQISNLQSNRNLLHNGAMQVHQRGTSTAGITGVIGYYTADRWKLLNSGGAAWTQSVENDAPTGSGFRKSLKVLCTTSIASPISTAIMHVRQDIEGQDLQRIAKGTASAQQLTLSFWVKANVTGTYTVELEDVDNSRHVGAVYTISASATWERKSITFPADTTGAFDSDNARSFSANWNLGAGSNYTSGTLPTTWAALVNANRVVGQTNLAAATNNYWQITGVQLEVGSVATPFEFKSYGQELRECQRYYIALGGSVGILTRMYNNGSGLGNVGLFVGFPVVMRVSPTSSSATVDVNDGAAHTPSVLLPGTHGFSIVEGGVAAGAYVDWQSLTASADL
jgi:hypothetical protein